MKLLPYRRRSNLGAVGSQSAVLAWELPRNAGRFDEAGETGLRRTRRRARKRLFDLLVICVLSPFILFVLVGVAVALAVTMRHSILFVQDRLGLDGCVFRMFKFRTMATNRPGGAVTEVEDARVTPLGRLLRQSHLDELPQVVNVVLGNMSLVGPRPEQPSLARQYTLDAPEFEYRLRVLPGITGLAQVCCSYAGNLSETMIKLSHDLYYIEHQTMRFDLWILVRTAVVVVRRGGR